MKRSRLIAVAFATIIATVAAAASSSAAVSYSPTSDSCELIPLMVNEGPDRRERLGLSSEPRGDSTEIRYGEPVTVAEARQIDELAKLEVDVRDEAAFEAAAIKRFGDSYVGIRWDQVAGGYVVSVADSAEGRDQVSADLERSFDVRIAGVEVIDDAVPQKIWEDQYERLVKLQAVLREELSISEFSVDVSCGHYLFEVDPGHQVGRNELQRWLEGQDPALAEVKFAINVLEEGEQTRPLARDTAYNPHRGGQEIRAGGGRCTSSIPMYKNEPGGGVSWWAVTAAHCLPDQPGYVSGTFGTDSLNWTIGTTIDFDINPGPSTTYHVYGGQYDIAVVQMDRSGVALTITDEHWWGDQTQAMDWWQWDPWNEVTGGPGIVGHTICQSGDSTNDPNNCGELISKTHTISYNATQSKHGVPIDLDNIRRVVGAGGISGDSGGTVWRESGTTQWYVGIFHGGSSSFLNYTHLRAARDFFGLTAPAQMW